MVKNLISDFLYRKLTFSYVYDDKPAKAGGKETIVMKMKKLAALVLAAAVLTTTVAPSVATPVYAATAEPVSYTHLDVYKRQMQRSFWESSRN